MYYKTYRDPDTGRYIGASMNSNLVVSGDTLEEIREELKNALRGYIMALGTASLNVDRIGNHLHIPFEIKEMEFDIDEMYK